MNINIRQANAYNYKSWSLTLKKKIYSQLSRENIIVDNSHKCFIVGLDIVSYFNYQTWRLIPRLKYINEDEYRTEQRKIFSYVV